MKKSDDEQEEIRLTDRLVQVPIPHIINRASRTPHDESTSTKQRDVGQRYAGRGV